MDHCCEFQPIYNGVGYTIQCVLVVAEVKLAHGAVFIAAVLFCYPLAVIILAGFGIAGERCIFIKNRPYR